MLEVGQYYETRAVRLDTDKLGQYYLRQKWVSNWISRGDLLEIPIIGQPHDDKDGQGEHYHIDTRFIALDTFKNYGLYSVIPASVPLILCSKPFYTYRTCVKTYLEKVDGATVIAVPYEVLKKRKNLTVEQIKASWTKCKKCPHQGHPLDENECITTQEGFIVCPLHNLNVHKNTGMIEEEYIERNLWEIN